MKALDGKLIDVRLNHGEGILLVTGCRGLLDKQAFRLGSICQPHYLEYEYWVSTFRIFLSCFCAELHS